MDRQLIKSLIDALAASDLSELEYTGATGTLRLVKGVPPVPANPAPAPSHQAPAPSTLASPAAAPGLVVAPLYGIVHLRRSPGTPLLVTPGQAVAAGGVLCLIEAMKVFTELRAEHDGTIAAVLVESGAEVEAGQPLFRLDA